MQRAERAVGACSSTARAIAPRRRWPGILQRAPRRAKVDEGLKSHAHLSRVWKRRKPWVGTLGLLLLATWVWPCTWLLWGWSVLWTGPLREDDRSR